MCASRSGTTTPSTGSAGEPGFTQPLHLEQVLRGFNAAYNARRQRVLDGKTPDQVAAERLEARRKLASAKPHGRAGPQVGAPVVSRRSEAAPQQRLDIHHAPLTPCGRKIFAMPPGASSHGRHIEPLQALPGRAPSRAS